MTIEEAEAIRRAAFRTGDACYGCAHCSHERELDVDRPEGDHLRYAYFRHCNVGADPFRCPAVFSLQEAGGYA